MIDTGVVEGLTAIVGVVTGHCSVLPSFKWWAGYREIIAVPKVWSCYMLNKPLTLTTHTEGRGASLANSHWTEILKRASQASWSHWSHIKGEDPLYVAVHTRERNLSS